MTATLTPPSLARHHVRIGHTTFVQNPFPTPAACCSLGSDCWCATGYRVRQHGVGHAETSGHSVLVADGKTLTTIEVTS